MASVELTAESSPTSWYQVGAEVYVKSNWADEWTWVPWVQPLSVEEGVGTQTGRAEFEYHYGPIARAELGVQDTYFPYFLSGTYIAVNVFDQYGEALLWIGVVEADTAMPHGSDVFAGKQTFVAYELSAILDRYTLYGSITENGYIDRPLIFNRMRERGQVNFGNRGATTVGIDSVPVFSDTNAVWNAYNVLQYILWWYVNYYPDGTARGLQFEIVGDTGILETIEEEWDLHGLTALQAIDKLIPRQRGVGWRIVTTQDVVYIWVFSAFTDPVVVGSEVIDANSLQVYTDFTQNRNVALRLMFDKQNEYDFLMVMGGHVYSCFTLSVADGTLSRAWNTPDEEGYKAGSSIAGAVAADHDALRSEDAYDEVYQRFIIPTDWDFFAGDGEGGTQYNAVPGIDYYGNVDASITPNVFALGAAFQRELPFAAPSFNADTPAYLRCFGFVNIPTTDDPPEDRWYRLDRLDPAGHQNCSIDVADDSLAVWIRPAINHMAALNHFDSGDVGTEESDQEPVWDWQDYIVTVNYRTDTRLQVSGYIPNKIPTELGKTKILEIPDTEAWYVVPGTVHYISDYALQHHSGGLLRDDTDRLRRIGQLASAWYAQPRSVVQYEIGTISLAHPVAYMIRGVLTAEGFTEVSTVVTRRTWRFGGRQSTAVETSYIDIDFAQIESDTTTAGSGGTGHGYGRRGAASVDVYRQQERDRSTVQIPLRPGATTMQTIPRVKVLPAIPTTGRGKAVLWISTDGGTGDDQIWESSPGDTRWYPRSGKWTDKSGVVV